MNIIDAELNGWSVGRFAEIHVQVLRVLACLEKCNVVAGVKVGQTIERRIVVVGRFSVKFGILVRMREESVEVVQQMPVSEN